jgi:hypothetical protein
LDELTEYAADGIFGFGFDPDCQYVNNDITFRVETAVPEPGSMLLLGMGLIGLTGIAGKKFAKK